MRGCTPSWRRTPCVSRSTACSASPRYCGSKRWPGRSSTSPYEDVYLPISNTPCVRCRQAPGTVEWGLEVSALETQYRRPPAPRSLCSMVSRARQSRSGAGAGRASRSLSRRLAGGAISASCFTRPTLGAPNESLIVLEQLRDAGINRLTFPPRTSNGGRDMPERDARCETIFLSGRTKAVCR